MQILGARGTLAQLLERICDRVSALEAARDGPVMVEQVCRARPDFRKKLDAIAQTSIGKTFRTAYGAALIEGVKGIPRMIDLLVERINEPSSTPALRCALVAVLAYVVQPRDIVPDDAPGGYGFVDDQAMLLVIVLQLTEPSAENAKGIENVKRTLASAESTLAPNAVAALGQAIQGVVLLFQSMSVLPPAMAELTTQQLLNDPTRAAAPAPPAGWQLPAMSPSSPGTFSGGACFEGNNVMFPSGLSLIGGQLHVPPPTQSW